MYSDETYMACRDFNEFLEARKIFEKNYLKEQLKRFKGNIAKTSIFIGMDRSALHRKLKELDIDINNFD